MNFELTEETLEEGRVALHQLEKQLNLRNNGINDNSSASSSKHQSITSERKILDQVPRNTRLNLRLESLGITVEELEDRGLLEGGGAVPSYYTSMKQKGRRVLELQPRSHRILEREKESLSRALNGVLHMVRILLRRDLPLLEYCRQRDPADRGLLHKKAFLALLRSIGLPFSARELLEVTQHYLVPSSEHVDYVAFLKDVGGLAVGTKQASGGRTVDADISQHTAVLFNVRRMLAESVRRLNRHPDDVYRMFAQWDTHGTGTVTATQLLRVLAKLHVALGDADQDFLVELLDTDAMGRIDFESLLSFCFGDSASFADAAAQSGSLVLGDDTLSAVSTDGNNSASDQKSTPSAGRRPHTAAATRPYAHSDGHRFQQHGAVCLPELNSSSSNSRSPLNRFGNSNPTGSGAGAKPLQRPLTASAARVPVSSGRTSAANVGTSHNADIQSKFMSQSGSAVDSSNERYLRRQQQQSDADNHANFVQEMPDDVIDDPEDGPRRTAEPSVGHRSVADQAADGGGGGSVSHADYHTQLTDQDEFYFGGHRDDLVRTNTTQNSRGGAVLSSYRPSSGVESSHRASGMSAQHGRPASSPVYSSGSNSFRAAKDSSAAAHQRSGTAADKLANAENASFSLLPEDAASPLDSEAEHREDPSGHLTLLANQILSALRDIVVARYRRGKSLQEIFLHFDRDAKGRFDCADFVRAASDLRIETSERVAAIAVSQMGLDGRESVSFGEFQVFSLDPDHATLVRKVQSQLAEVYEREGRDYSRWIEQVFWTEDTSLGKAKGDADSAGRRQSGFVSAPAFSAALTKLGVVLTSSEVQRLVDRFDVRGDGACSVERFLRMVRCGDSWLHAETQLGYQEQASEEANYLRQQLQSGAGTGYPQLSEELIGICEYLGIRVLSEQHLLWIASDALKAPLPASWTAQKDRDGRTYFYNHLSNQARWDHPLDPHFRQLRDKYRQSPSEPAALSSEQHPVHIAHQNLVSVAPRPQLAHFQSPYAATQQQIAENRRNALPPANPSKALRGGSATEGLVLTHQPSTGQPVASSARASSAPSKRRPVSAPSNAEHSFVPLNAESAENNTPTSTVPGQQFQTASSRAIVEAIYSTPYLKTPLLPQPAGMHAAHRSYNGASATANATLNSGTSKPRPSSSRPAGTTAGLSAVERAVNYGKNTPNYLLPKGKSGEAGKGVAGGGGKAVADRNSRFGRLFEADLIDRLDDLMQARPPPPTGNF